MTLTYGHVIHPPVQERLIPDAATHAWDDLSQRNPVGACFHTMVGTLSGTDGWFRFNAAPGRGPDGLTDYGAGGRRDGPNRDGVILCWNDPRGRPAGWANGGCDGLEGDG